MPHRTEHSQHKKFWQFLRHSNGMDDICRPALSHSTCPSSPPRSRDLSEIEWGPMRPFQRPIQPLDLRSIAKQLPATVRYINKKIIAKSFSLNMCSIARLASFFSLAFENENNLMFIKWYFYVSLPVHARENCKKFDIL